MPLSRSDRARLTPANLLTLQQEEVDQIYARLTAGPIPDGAYRGDLFFSRGESMRPRLEEILGGIGGRIAAEKIELLERVGRTLWKGKLFDRQQLVLRNFIEDFKPLEPLIDDPSALMTAEMPRGGFLGRFLPKTSVWLLFPAKLYCGQSLLDGPPRSVIVDYLFGDEIQGYQASPDSLAGRGGLRVRDEIRMVRPGFYLGRAYANRAFLLNFTLYNPEVADAGTEAFARASRSPRTAGPASRAGHRRCNRRRRSDDGGVRGAALARRRRGRRRRRARADQRSRSVGADAPGRSRRTRAEPAARRALAVRRAVRDQPARTPRPEARYDLPFPFERLLDQLNARIAPAKATTVLIPLGRSLQRFAADPDYFDSPRLVAAVTEDGDAPDRARLKDRLYIGYQERADEIEVISYNETAGRFEFQLVDYRAGSVPRVEYAERFICVGCHQGHGPIFPTAAWNETNADPEIAGRLSRLGESFHGAPTGDGLDRADAFDRSTDRAGRLAFAHALWAIGCGEPDEPEAAQCRGDLLLAALRHRLAGNGRRGMPTMRRAQRWPIASTAGWRTQRLQG